MSLIQDVYQHCERMHAHLIKHAASLPEWQEDANDAGKDHENEGHNDPEPEITEAPRVTRRDLQATISSDSDAGKEAGYLSVLKL